MQTTTEAEQEEAEPEEESNSIQSNKLSPTADLEFHWFIVVLTTIFTILEIFLIAIMTIFFSIWIKKWTNQEYFKRNPGVNNSTKSRPFN